MPLCHYCCYPYSHLHYHMKKNVCGFSFLFSVSCELDWSLCEKENNCRTYQCLFGEEVCKRLYQIQAIMSISD